MADEFEAGIAPEPLPEPPPAAPPRLWSWRDLLWILAGIVIVLVGGGLLIGLYQQRSGLSPEELLTPTLEQSLGLALLEGVALVIGVAVFGLLRRRLAWEAVGVRPIGAKWTLISLGVAAFAIPASGIITLLVLLAFDLPLQNPQLDFILPEGFSWGGALGMILLVGVAVPFAEELFFRGFLYQFIKERLGVWPGILLSSMIFGAVHGDIAVGLTAFLLGILLAVVYEYSRSLWAAVIVHALNNSAKVALLYLLVALGLDRFL
jgi:membrane protease YdiL (CAAX protease family)